LSYQHYGILSKVRQVLDAIPTERFAIAKLAAIEETEEGENG